MGRGHFARIIPFATRGPPTGEAPAVETGHTTLNLLPCRPRVGNRSPDVDGCGCACRLADPPLFGSNLLRSAAPDHAAPNHHKQTPKPCRGPLGGEHTLTLPHDFIGAQHLVTSTPAWHAKR